VPPPAHSGECERLIANQSIGNLLPFAIVCYILLRRETAGLGADARICKSAGYVTKRAPHLTLKLIARGKLTNAEGFDLHRVVWGSGFLSGETYFYLV